MFGVGLAGDVDSNGGDSDGVDGEAVWRMTIRTVKRACKGL